MIALENVTKCYRVKGETKSVLRGITYTFETGRNIGILGANGAGKSTLMRLMDGTLDPTSGRVRRHGRISRLGIAHGFHGSLTGAENVRFVSRIYGQDYHDILSYVADFAELGDDLFMPVKTYSSGMAARLKLGLSFAMRFDMYLIDEGTSAGDQRFQERCLHEIKNRLQTSDFIVVSHNGSSLKQWCTHAIILHNGIISELMPLHDATLIYRKLLGLP